VGTYQTDEYTKHSHGITDYGHIHQLPISGNTTTLTGPGAWTTYGKSTINDFSNSVAATTNITINASGTSLETRPFNYGVNWIIKL
jgi:hypothetical protein